LWRVVDFKTISLKVPQEVSGVQAIHTRLIVLLSWLRGGWCRVCLLAGVDWLLTCSWDNSGEFLLLTNSSGGVGVLSLLALFVCFSILRWYIHRDDQDLAI
jgi:hypothetical protein